jgi:hypothetical protein
VAQYRGTPTVSTSIGPPKSGNTLLRTLVSMEILPDGARTHMISAKTRFCRKSGLWKRRMVEKSQKADFPTMLGNPAKHAGFPLSPSPDGDYLIQREERTGCCGVNGSCRQYKATGQQLPSCLITHIMYSGIISAG